MDAAQRLMLAKGFAATTVDEICEAAKLTKGSFFHYFKTKERLGEEVLERFCAQAQQQLRSRISERETDPLKRTYAYIDAAIAFSKECTESQGCLLGTFAQELSDTHPAMRLRCAKAFTQWAQALAVELEGARLRYAPKSQWEAEDLAEHFIAVLEGARLIARVRQDRRVVERSLRHFKRYLAALFEKP